MAEKPKVFLLNDLEPASLRAMGRNQIDIFGVEFGEYVNLKMQAMSGEGWIEDIKTLRQTYRRFNYLDFSTLISEILRSDSPIRKILPPSTYFYTTLGKLKTKRDKYSHNDSDDSPEGTIGTFELVIEASRHLSLVNSQETAIKTVTHIQNMLKGIFLSEQEESEQQLSIEADQDSKAEEIAQYDSQIEELRSELKSKDQVIDDLIQKAKSIDSAHVLSEIDLRAMQESLEEERKDRARLESKLDIATEKLSKSQDDLKRLKDVTTLLIDKHKLLKSKLENSSSWPLELKLSSRIKGRRKFILSAVKRDLIDKSNDQSLKEIHGEIVVHYVEKWLKIRPTGGRVFIDDEGFATTVIDNKLYDLDRVDF